MRISNSTLCVQTHACNNRDTEKFCLLITLVLGFIALLSFTVIVDADDTDAEYFTVDGLKYETTSGNTVKLLGSEGSYPINIKIPTWVEHSGKRYVTSIGERAFQGCISLRSIEIPNSVRSIGQYAFSNCESLTSVIIPGSITSIGNHAFYGCISMDAVAIPDSVTSLEDAVFCHCISLRSVTFGNGVESIGKEMFKDCISLTSVTIGNNVTSICEFAFCGCVSLTSVTIPGNVYVIDIGGDVFKDCKYLQNIYVPDKKFNDYSKAECWRPWENHLKRASEIPATDIVECNCTIQTSIGMDADAPLTTMSDPISYSSHGTCSRCLDRILEMI